MRGSHTAQHCGKRGNHFYRAMAALKNRRWEAFAQAYVLGGPVAVCYEDAGYKPGPNSRSNGSKVRHKPAVDRRIKELQELGAERAVVAIEWVQHQLVDVALGKTPAKTIANSKGETEEIYDRLGGLSALNRSLNPGGGVTVNATATAQAAAIAEADIENMSAPDLARRVSYLIEQAAAQTGDPGDDTAPGDPIDPNPPPKERAKAVVGDVLRLAQQIKGDHDTLRYMHDLLSRATQAISHEIAAAAG